MGLFNIFKNKNVDKSFKVNALKQDIIAEIMSNEKYSGQIFEGLTDKQIKSLERTRQNPVFEITKHKVNGFFIVQKGKSYNVLINNEKVGTIKKDEVTDNKLNIELEGFISGGKQKYMDSTNEGNVKLYTTSGRYILYLK